MARVVSHTGSGGVTIALAERRAFFGDSEIDLTPREYEILARLVERPGWVLSAEQLSEQTAADYSSPFAVNVHVVHLRAKLAAAGAPANTIETVRGAGWRLNARRADGTGVGLALAEGLAAFKRGDSDAAYECLDAAEARLAGDHVGRERSRRLAAIILERRGAIDSRCGAFDEAYDAYHAALSLRPLGDHYARARLNTRVGWLCTLGRRRGEASKAFASALSELDAVRDDTQGWWRSWIEVRLQQLESAYITELPAGPTDPERELGEPVCRFGTLTQRAKYHGVLATREYHAGRYVVSDACLEHQRESLRCAERSDSDFVHGLQAAALGSYLIYRRDLLEGEARLRESIDLCRRCGDRFGEKAAVMFLVLSARYGQDVRRTERMARELECLLDGPSEMPEFTSSLRAHLAWVSLRRRKYEQATRLADEALEIWDEDPACSQAVWMMAWPAVACAVHAGDSERAFEYAALMLRDDQCLLDGGLGEDLAEALRMHALGDGEQAFDRLVALERDARLLAYT